MSLRSPVVAMLWENWRLTRIEVAQRLALGLVAASAALVLAERGALIAFWILLTQQAFFYLSIAKLNGGRFIDGYKPGFPLYLYYTRPVRTATFVGVAMAYDALTAAASYLACAALLGLVFGKPLPMWPMAMVLVTFHLAYLAVQWSTRNRVVQWIGSILIGWPPFLVLLDKVKTFPRIEFSPVEYLVMAVICIVALALTVGGVARQRCGDAIASVPRKAGTPGYPEWLVNLVRFPCPTSSATRAQVWFEMRSSGLPILLIGLSIAVGVVLLYTLGIVSAPLRPAAVAAPIMFGIPALLLVFGGNAFGIRRKQGRSYLGTFESTQPFGTAQMAGLKVLVRTGCVLTALILVIATVWLSTSLLGTWGSWEMEGKDTLPNLIQTREKIGDAFAGLSVYVHALQAVLLAIFVAATVTTLATFTALRTRYPRHLRIAGALLLFDILSLVLLAWAVNRGVAPQSVLRAVTQATLWVVVALVACGTAYLAWRVCAERVVSPRQALLIALAGVTLGAGWLMLLRAAGVSLAGLSATEAMGGLAPALLPLILAVLAPWSLSRVRHS
ncbi:MAG TPA: hypothetical protein VFP37_05490 [Steroidobacteraceae bacterium]|nr:hypothetical protein [Steroidobacteraceae bacterium]